MSSWLFLSVRVLHILLAALWFGAIVFISMFLMPVIEQSGPAGGAMMGRLNARGLVPFMASISGLTIVTGFLLYYRFTAGFDPVISASAGGKVFGAGGVLGLAAGIIGGSVVGRSAKRASELGAKAASLPEGKERAAMMAEIQQLRRRMITFGNIVIALMLGAIVLMSIGHYV